MTDPTDSFIATACALAGIPVQAEWLPTIRLNYETSLRVGGLVTDLPLPDEAEPAPVYWP